MRIKKRGYIILVANEDGYMDIDIRGHLSTIAPALACSMQEDGIRDIIFQALLTHFKVQNESIREFSDVFQEEVQEIAKLLQQLKEEE